MTAAEANDLLSAAVGFLGLCYAIRLVIRTMRT